MSYGVERGKPLLCPGRKHYCRKRAAIKRRVGQKNPIAELASKLRFALGARTAGANKFFVYCVGVYRRHAESAELCAYVSFSAAASAAETYKFNIQSFVSLWHISVRTPPRLSDSYAFSIIS